MVTIDSLLVHKPSQTFFVPIKGDSMCEVGLLEGDTAVCERRQQARPGEIVVAVVNDELTIKTLMLETSLMQEALMQEEHRQEALMQEEPLQEELKQKHHIQEERTEEPMPNKLMGQTGAQEKSSQAKLSQKNRSGGKPGKQGQRLVLKPENPNYPILRPDPLEIIGVVTGSFRSYRR